MSSTRSRTANGWSSSPRLARLSLPLVGLFHAFVPMVKALPLGGIVHALKDEDLPKSPNDASLWLYLSVAIALVLAGGVFAGLTIAYVHHGPAIVQRYANMPQLDGSGRNLPAGTCAVR
jgi:metal transporter CNNM